MIAPTRKLVLALFLGSYLLLPPASAFAAGTAQQKHPGGCASAVCVYTEQQSTPTGQQALGRGSSRPAPLPSGAAHALSQYRGADKRTIKTLATSPAYSIGHGLRADNRVASSPTGKAAGAFDLGAGGTSLFYLLAVSAGLVLIAAGVRLFRR